MPRMFSEECISGALFGLAVIALLPSAHSATVSSTTLAEIDSPYLAIEQRFEMYKTAFGKQYTPEQSNAAYSAFKSNDALIQATNANKSKTYELGHNDFSDLTLAQFSAKYIRGGLLKPKPEERKFDYSLVNETSKAFRARVDANGESLDWVAKGAVTSVKNQGQCGSCWAFSTTGSLEGHYQINGNPLTSISEQDLVSCDDGDSGCGGGLMEHAMDWVSNNGICTEENYPYESGGGDSGSCRRCKAAVTCDGHHSVPGEDGLVAAIARGPVSVGIEADRSAFQMYRRGILDDEGCGRQIDHGVLAVGYGTSDGGDPYYKVKNSWGGSWGEEGYLRIARNKDMCGIGDSAAYPTNVRPIGGPSPPAPTPNPGPAPGPGPSPSSDSHYEDPSGGCRSDETELRLDGIGGRICAPRCDASANDGCPSDTPDGVSARPSCMLGDDAAHLHGADRWGNVTSVYGKVYCALSCGGQDDDSCGDGASCRWMHHSHNHQRMYLCTYD